VPGPGHRGREALLKEAGYDDSNPLKVDMYSSEIIPAMVNLTQLFSSRLRRPEST
jgi:hypothetical protein